MTKAKSILLFLLCSFAVSAQVTPNYGFQVPAPGTLNWNTLLNQNFFQLDSMFGHVVFDNKSNTWTTGTQSWAGATITLPVKTVTSTPVGACTPNGQFETNTAGGSGNLYECIGGFWSVISGGGGGITSFGGITSGTNTSASMIVSTGASISPSGTGTISANILPVSAFGSLPSALTSGNQVILVNNHLTDTPCAITSLACYSNGANWFQWNGGAGGAGNVTSGVTLTNNQLVVGAGTTAIKVSDLTGAVTTAGGTATTIAPTGAIAATYGDSTHVGQVTVNAAGQVTSASNVAIVGSGAASGIRTGSVIPGTCTVGDVFFLTTAPAGQQLYQCSATNIFTQTLAVGGGGGVAVTAGVLDTTTSVCLNGNSCTVTGLWTSTKFAQTEIAAPGTLSAAGTDTYYTNSGDHKLHTIDSTGADALVGSGGTGGGVTATTFASLPAAGGVANQMFRITDTTNGQNCTSGGISAFSFSSLCISNGTSYLPVAQVGDTVLPTYAVDSNSPFWNQHWQSALAHATSRQVIWNIYADSIAVCWTTYCGGVGDGPGAIDKAHRWPDLLKQVLRGKGLYSGGLQMIQQSLNGATVVSNDASVWALTGTAVGDPTLGFTQATDPSSVNLGSSLIKMSAAATATWVSPEPYDHFKVYCMTGPATAGFHVTIDGIASADICTAQPGSNTATSTASISAGYAGTHTVVFTAIGSFAYLWAAQDITGTTGVVVNNLAAGGASCGYYEDETGGHNANKTAFMDIFTQHDLDLYSVGVNDEGVGYTPSQFNHCLGNLMVHNATLGLTNVGGPSQLLMNEHHFYNDGATNFSVFWAAGNQAAIANGAGFMTMGDRWGTFQQANGGDACGGGPPCAGLGKMYTDGIHENTFGSQDYARMVLHKLFNVDDFPLGFAASNQLNAVQVNCTDSAFCFGADLGAILTVSDLNTHAVVGAPSGQAGFQLKTAAGAGAFYLWDNANGGILPGTMAYQGIDGHLKLAVVPTVVGAKAGTYIGPNINALATTGAVMSVLESGQVGLCGNIAPTFSVDCIQATGDATINIATNDVTPATTHQAQFNLETDAGANRLAVSLLNHESTGGNGDNTFWFYQTVGGYSGHIIAMDKNGDVGIGNPSGAFGLTQTFFALNNGAIALQRPTVFGSLPTCNAGAKGWIFYITDGANTPTYTATTTGGGSTMILTACDGTNWKNH